MLTAISTWLIKKLPWWCVSWTFRKIFGRKDLQIFEKILSSGKWKKVSDTPTQKWIFEGDNSFVIEVSSESRNFQEAWTDNFPDPSSSLVEVYLKINGEFVTSPLSFVHVDGCRYFVPLPERRGINGQVQFYWNFRNLSRKVFDVIGYLHFTNDTLEDFAERAGIKVIE